MNRLLRNIAPYVLLASYLPMVLLSSLHTHHDTIDTRDDCGQCAGHIDNAHHHDHDCPYCTFLNLNCIVQDGAARASIHPATGHIAVPTPATMPQTVYGVASLRAPPVA